MTEHNNNGSDFVWWPDETIRRTANWTAFIEAEGLADYSALEQRAAAEPEWFWDALLRHLDIRFTRPYTQVLDLSKGLPWPNWCIGGETNLVLNAMDRWPSAQREKTAITWVGEDGTRREWSYAQLDEETCRLANGLACLGLTMGDVVGLYLPMVPEAVSALLAVSKLGCIALPLFSGFGKDAVATRLTDGGARAVITVDHSLRRGRRIGMKSVIDEAASLVPSLEHVIVARRDAVSDVHMQAGRDVWLHELSHAQPATRETLSVPAEHPALLVFTSGTSGRPKGTVHTHAGLTAKAALDYGLCLDLKASDRFQRFTDFGWFAGPMMIAGSLLTGAAMVLAEGTPDYPTNDRLWQLIEQEKVTVLGMVPTLARSLRASAEATIEQYDLSSLRLILSSGESWDRESWMWVFERLCRRRLPLMNYCGGTELGGLLATNLLLPMKPGGFSGPIPGTGADILDAQGHSVPAGQVGELVMRSASIGTTRGLWREPERYIDSYWSIYPGIWAQGDAAMRDVDGVWWVIGRSDDTIKIAGKRTGPAEIEDILLSTGLVAEAAAIGLPDPDKGASLVCAIVLRSGQEPSAKLGDEMRKRVALGAGTSFRPDRILFVNDLPKTRNMKVMRRVVRSVLSGEAPGDLSALINPDSLTDLRRAADADAEAMHGS